MRGLLFLFAFSLLFGSTSLAQNPTQSANPRAVPIEANSDVGAYGKGAKISHDFLIRNDGNAPLLVTDARPSCGCTVADFDKTISPGKVGKVRVEVDTSAFSGPIAKAVTVFTNDPLMPQFQLILRANIALTITAKPGYARFLVVQNDSASSESVQVLSAADGTPFDVLRADTNVVGLKVTYAQATEDQRLPNVTGKQWVLRMELSGDAAVGPLADHVYVTTNHPRQKQVDIPVTGFVRPPLAATPSGAEFGSAEAPMGRIISVRNLSTSSIVLTSVESDTKGVDVYLEPVEQGREYNIKIALQTTVAKGPLNAKVTVHTDSKKVPVLVIPVKGTIR